MEELGASPSLSSFDLNNPGSCPAHACACVARDGALRFELFVEGKARLALVWGGHAGRGPLINQTKNRYFFSSSMP